MENKTNVQQVQIHPLTAERWQDFERLFGSEGAHGGCWCMWWRSAEEQFKQQAGEGNRLAMKQLVESGKIPGFIAYINGEPVGWCSIGPRVDFPALYRYWHLDQTKEADTWSIVCFYIAEPYRRQGLMTDLLHYVLEYAVSQGAKIIEGFPYEVKKELTEFHGYTGVDSTYRMLGFVEVERGNNQVFMQYRSKG